MSDLATLVERAEMRDSERGLLRAILPAGEVHGSVREIAERVGVSRRVLITANLSKDQLWACLGDRVQSRVTQAGLTQNITGKDRRAQGAA